MNVSYCIYLVGKTQYGEKSFYFYMWTYHPHVCKIANSLLKLHILSDKIITLYVNIGGIHNGSIKSNWKILRQNRTLD